jgi:hypothetical protein
LIYQISYRSELAKNQFRSSRNVGENKTGAGCTTRRRERVEPNLDILLFVGCYSAMLKNLPQKERKERQFHRVKYE